MGSIAASDSSTLIAEDFNLDKFKPTVSEYMAPDKKMEEQVKRPLVDRINRSPLQVERHFVTLAVDCVKVRGPSDAFRESQCSLWNAEKNSAGKWGGGALIVGAVGIFTGIREKNPLIASIGVIAGTILGWIWHSKSSEATKQIEGWQKSPFETVAKQRTLAYERGFVYAYYNNLKLSARKALGEILHPLEVEALYKKYTDNFLDKVKVDSNNKRSDWVKSFTSDNPFSGKLMFYGFGKVPSHLQAIVNDYATYKSYISDINKGYEKLKEQSQDIAKQRIEEINAQRNKELQPFVKEKDDALKNAKDLRDREIKDQSIDTHKNFAAKKEIIENDFKGKTVDINKKYDDKVKTVESERDKRFAAWDNKKDDQIGTTYAVGRDLMEKASAAWKGQTQYYQPVQWVQYGYYPQYVYAQPPVAPQPIYYAQPAYPQ